MQMSAHELFLIYVRTLQFMKLRLRGIDESEGIFIPQSEIATRFFPSPKYNLKSEIQKLVQSNQLATSESFNTKTGHKMYFYEALLPGAMDIRMIKPRGFRYDSDTLKMIEFLKLVSLADSCPESPMYFTAFLKFRPIYIELFFTVDDFSGRIHTPVTSLKSNLRQYLLIENEPTVSFDVATMQPLLLGKVLKHSIGPNEFSTWMETGQDIYTILQQKAGLKTRDEGKKRFFQISFARPSDEMAVLFGESDWIKWINEYKNQPEPRNLHCNGKLHNNLAWLLQSTEVSLMRQVWNKLIQAGIPFLSVHDEIIVKHSDHFNALSIFQTILKEEFSFFKLNFQMNNAIQTVSAAALKIPTPSSHLASSVSYGNLDINQEYIPERDQFPVTPFDKIPISWKTEIQSLVSFFSSTSLPTTPLRLDQCTIIHHLPTFISGHLSILHRNNGNPTFLPYLNRLLKLCEILNSRTDLGSK